uniref:putative protein tag-278 n=1 Tax=Ciona intestinalis TaxID=7719 RepID=UPI000EF52066|nr:putative protein tag-278 [Ciona intestinalis]|eukprot:XP_026689881.1 putative protein tag-278 [Ciona intestinalis]
MKPAKMKSLSPIMERHTPQHPLPDDLKNLPNDETVCQFCGVSYLIHHEIKKLEEMVAHLEQELKFHQGSEEREQKLREELEKNKQATLSLHDIIADRDKTIETITADFETERNKNESLTSRLVAEEKKSKQFLENNLEKKAKYQTSLYKVQSAINLVKLDFSKLRTEVSPAEQNASVFKDEVFTKFSHLLSNCSEDMRALRRKNSCLSEDLQVLASECDAAKKRAENAEHRIGLLLKDAENLKSDQSGQISALQNKIQELEELYADRTKEIKMLEMKENSARSDQAEMEAKLKKKQLEVQSMTVKMQKTEDSAASTIQRLNQDCRQLERELASLNEETMKMRNREKEREKRDQERNRQNSLAHGQMEQLNCALNDAKNTVKTLTAERELMTSSHQHQIQQLRESFRSKLEASESTPIRAQQELQAMQERHREEMQEFERTLRDEFRIEMSVEKDKQAEAISSLKSKFKNEMHELEYDLKRDAESDKNEISSLKQKVDYFTKNAEEKKIEFEEERQSLKQMVSQLEERITALTQEQEDREEEKRFASSTASQKWKDMEEKNENLQRDMIAMKEEVELLQETVRRECEERYELTEALSQARDDLKTATVSLVLIKKAFPFAPEIIRLNRCDNWCCEQLLFKTQTNNQQRND